MSRTLERAIAELVREHASVTSAIERCEVRLEELRARAEVIDGVLEPLRRALPAAGGGLDGKASAPPRSRGDSQAEAVRAFLLSRAGQIVSSIQVAAAIPGLEPSAAGSILSRLHAMSPDLERVSRGRYRLTPNGSKR